MRAHGELGYAGSQDWLSCYYRDDSILWGYRRRLMLQLFAKKNNPFSGGRLLQPPSLNREDLPKVLAGFRDAGYSCCRGTMRLQFRENDGEGWDEGICMVMPLRKSGFNSCVSIQHLIPDNEEYASSA